MLAAMLRQLWIEVRSSLWFVPGLLVICAIVLALSLVQIDIAYAGKLSRQSWTPWLNAGADGARGMLAAIAGSMITVAGVAFSITIVTLSLASTQYTPRILRTFMRDRANQAVLGVFVGIFTYCLIVMRTIRAGTETEPSFVPLVAVFAALLLALVSIGFLIFFIHHTAASIQAAYLLDAVTKDTLAAVDSLFPEELGEESGDADAAAELAERTWHPIGARRFGYIQSVSTEGLMRFAKERDVTLRIERTVGEFVVDGAPLVSIDRAPEEKNDGAAAINAHFAIGDFRTVEQDPGFGIRQIVDIAMKALSPGVNDTSTAVSCLDYLSVILCRLAARRIESPFREDSDEKGRAPKLRVIAPRPSFAEHVARSFDEVRLSAHGNVTILLHLLCAIERVAHVTRSAGRRQTLILHARLTAELADHTVPEPYDRERINRALTDARETLQAGLTELPSLASKSSDARWR